MTAIRLYLDTLHPLAWHALVAAVAWLACYLVRRRWPLVWETKVPKDWQAVPALLVAAVCSGAISFATADATTAAMVEIVAAVVRDTVLGGALSGAAAVGAHHALKELPGPYLGGSWPAAGQAPIKAKPKPKAPPPTLLLALWLYAASLPLPGCGATQSLDADMPPGCRTEDLGTLTAAYAGELVYVCREYPSLEACPLELQDPVHDRYERRFDDWEHCKTLGKPRDE